MPLMARFFLRRLHPSTEKAAALRLSTTAAPPASHFLPDFLVAHCGLLPSEGDKVSKRILARVKSLEKPTATLDYLRSIGLQKAHLRTVVIWRPQLLIASVDNTLRPKVDILLAAGFSEDEVPDIIGSNPNLLHFNFKPNLEFLQAYVPDRNKLRQVIHRRTRLLACSLSRKLEPNAALLQRRGVPVQHISRALLTAPRVFLLAPESVEGVIDRAEQLGFSPACFSFVYALLALSQNNKELLEEKIEMMKSFGWSEHDFYTAFYKNPMFILRSTATLRAKMRFLVEEARLDRGCIIRCPNILFLSLKKRLIRRYKVFEMLGLQGLQQPELGPWLFTQTDSEFIEHFVTPNLQKVPALLNVYPNVCVEETPT